jgi:putative SOS response-associated peptidase YedK
VCNEVARRIALGEIRDDWSQLKIPLIFPEGLPNLAPLDSIRITDTTLILRAGAGGVEGVVRRWSWPGAGGRPVYNYRSEGRGFAGGAGAGRCLLPVDAFYEFTDPPADAPKKARKTKWRFVDAVHPWFCIAGWWRTDPGVGEAFTLLTGEPGPDIAPYHHRQIMLPARETWGGWLDGSLSAAQVLRPSPAGSLRVEPGTPDRSGR